MSTYRETLMARFLKDIPDEDLEDHPNVYSWLTHEADKAARELHEGAGKPGAGLVGLKMLQEGPMSGVAALMFAAEFTAAGAKNYYEMTYETADLGNVVVTIQRVQGLTPAAKLEKATDQVTALAEYVRASVNHWDTRLDELGSLSETAEELLINGRGLLKAIQDNPV